MLDIFDCCLILNGFLVLLELIILICDFYNYKSTQSCLNISLFFILLTTILNGIFYHEFRNNSYIVLEVVQFVFNVAIWGIILSIWLATIETPESLEDDEVDEDDTNDDIIEDSMEEN